MCGVLILAVLLISKPNSAALGVGGPGPLVSNDATSAEGAEPPYALGAPQNVLTPHNLLDWRQAYDGVGEPIPSVAPDADPPAPPDVGLVKVPDAPPGGDFAAALPPVIDYVVKAGDTLSGIAEVYNTDVLSLVAANNLVRRDVLQIGTTLKVPTAQGVLYTVVRGDTLWDIAQQYGIAEADIMAFNKLTSDGAILPGQELVLPGATPAPVAAAGIAVASRGGGDRSSSSSSSPPPSGGGGSESGLYIWPVRGPVTSGFGPRWGAFHSGIDIGVPYGVPIAASRGGTVIRAGWRGDYGYAVEISHGGGVSTLYGHMSQILVNVGQRVGQGDTIGKVGSTGNSTGPHVHFEVRINGSRVNPIGYLP